MIKHKKNFDYYMNENRDFKDAVKDYNNLSSHLKQLYAEVF